MSTRRSLGDQGANRGQVDLPARVLKVTTWGAVLCGGASRRMGRDKALLRVDGDAMAARAARALRAGGCSGVLAVGGDSQALGELGLTPVADRWPGAGPLAGLATALASGEPGDTLVIAPCDLLDPSPRLVRALLIEIAAHPDVDAVVPSVAGRREWTTSAWRVSDVARSTLAEAIVSGRRRLDTVEGLVRWAPVHGIDAAAVRDADRPGDLEGR